VNKQQLIEAVARQLGDDVSKRQVEEIVNTSLDTVAATLRRGESVQLTGFGTFEARRRAARKGLNPRTGEPVRIRATTVPAFKAGKSLKDIVAKRVAAKKATAKKATAKKATAKKATAKKATAKKAPAKATRKQATKRSAKTARKR
jgi:DNA-binding protein HU-beta